MLFECSDWELPIKFTNIEHLNRIYITILVNILCSEPLRLFPPDLDHREAENIHKVALDPIPLQRIRDARMKININGSIQNFNMMEFYNDCMQTAAAKWEARWMRMTTIMAAYQHIERGELCKAPMRTKAATF